MDDYLTKKVIYRIILEKHFNNEVLLSNLDINSQLVQAFLSDIDKLISILNNDENMEVIMSEQTNVKQYNNSKYLELQRNLQTSKVSRSIHPLNFKRKKLQRQKDRIELASKYRLAWKLMGERLYDLHEKRFERLEEHYILSRKKRYL